MSNLSVLLISSELALANLNPSGWLASLTHTFFFRLSVPVVRYPLLHLQSLLLALQTPILDNTLGTRSIHLST